MTFALAPLADFTDAPFRLMCFEGGADLAYTEMVSAAALAHGHGPSRTLFETMPGEGPVGCQLFGAGESELAAAVRETSAARADDGVSPRFREINLNAGCPMAKVTRSGAGAKLVESPERIGALLRAMKENTDLPVTLKTRLGPNPSRTAIFEILDAAEQAGAAGLILHARYTSQMHGGPVHLDLLAEVARRARIPVTGNGSVRTAADVATMAAAGVCGVMIGRAALNRPGIFAALREASRQGGADGGTAAAAPEPPEPAGLFMRHLGHLRRFHALLRSRHPDLRLPDEDAFVALKVRTHLFRYFAGVPGAAALRAHFNSVRSLRDALAILADVAPSATV